MSGTVNGNQLGGTYYTLSAGVSTGEYGTFASRRSEWRRRWRHGFEMAVRMVHASRRSPFERGLALVPHDRLAGLYRQALASPHPGAAPKLPDLVRRAVARDRRGQKSIVLGCTCRCMTGQSRTRQSPAWRFTNRTNWVAL